MACFSSVQVVIRDVPRTDTVHIEAVAFRQAAALPVAGSCVGSACRERGVRLDGFAPDTIRLRVRTRRGTHEQVLAPVYVGHYINGRHCRAACRHARVEVTPNAR